jgi:TonB family protein
MGLLFNCVIGMAGAGMFSLPFDITEGPPAELPPLIRYEPPAFPAALRATSVSDGYAKMMFTIDGQGRVDDAVALEASHPAFADSVIDALSRWRFQDSASDTKPRREVIQFQFKRTGLVSAVSQRDASKSFFPGDSAPESRPIRTVAATDPRAVPERIVSAAPVYPKALRKQRDTGYASVSFVIDATGSVRVPAVTGESDREFGLSALDAVRQWRFAPPAHASSTVHVLVERSFSFGTSQR